MANKDIMMVHGYYDGSYPGYYDGSYPGYYGGKRNRKGF